MINNPRDTIMSTYNPDLVQAALRNAITQFQQQTLALSTSAGATLSDPTSATGINTGPGYYRHSRASSLAAPNNNKNAKRRKVYIAFDLYGTLLSTDSIVPELAKHYGHEAAPGIATLWRRFQLEYTWRITSMGEFKNFHEITRSALGHALMEHSGIKLTATAAAQLMKAYDALHTFPDVEAGLSMLKKAKAGEAVDTASGIRKKLSPPPENQDETDGDEIAHSTLQEPPEIETFIFTNGTPDMVLRSVVTSPELSPHTKASENGLFSDPDCIVTVDHVQCYKPDPRTYKHLMDVAGIRTEQDRRNMWVVSANPFDVVGAKAAGLRAAWIDRSGRGWVDRLDEMRVPSVTATGVDEAVKAILSWN